MDLAQIKAAVKRSPKEFFAVTLGGDTVECHVERFRAETPVGSTRTINLVQVALVTADSKDEHKAYWVEPAQIKGLASDYREMVEARAQRERDERARQEAHEKRAIKLATKLAGLAGAQVAMSGHDANAVQVRPRAIDIPVNLWDAMTAALDKLTDGAS